MNNSELDRILKSAPVPERPAEYWREFPGSVMGRLREGDRGGAAEPEHRPGVLFWGLGLATACLLIACAAAVWLAGQPAAANSLTAQDFKLLREVMTMFPNSVRAVAADESGVHLELSDRPDVPVSTPLLIRVYQGSLSQSVITFSGQTVELAGRPVEVLADARGDILLVAEGGVWSSAEGGRLFAHSKVEARVLHVVL